MGRTTLRASAIAAAGAHRSCDVVRRRIGALRLHGGEVPDRHRLAIRACRRHRYLCRRSKCDPGLHRRPVGIEPDRDPRQHAQPGLHAPRLPGHGDSGEHDASSPFCPVPLYDSDTGNGRHDEYDHALIPTVVGTYTFHVFGTINGVPVDQTIASGPTTFDSIADSSAVQFPVVIPAAAAVATQGRRGEVSAPRARWRARSPRQRRQATRRRAHRGQRHSRSSRSSSRWRSAHSIWR